MSRIVAGSVAGRTLQIPKQGTRPTSERVREALFSRLEHWGAIKDARVLDLFAGSGAIAFEALSRGGHKAVLVEQNDKACQLLRVNAKNLGFIPQTQVVKQDVFRFVATKCEPSSSATSAIPTISTISASNHNGSNQLGFSPYGFDLVFIDPPYALADTSLNLLLLNLATSGLIASQAIVVTERAKRSSVPLWPKTWKFIDDRSWGDTTCYFAEVVDQNLAIS